LPLLSRSLGNIVLSGGHSLFPGLPERLDKELSIILPPHHPHKIVAAPDRLYSVWKGGSLVASATSFNSRSITRDEYNEEGPALVRTRFL